MHDDEKTELIKRTAQFLALFELVFDNDWSFTKATICDDEEYRELFVAENGGLGRLGLVKLVGDVASATIVRLPIFGRS